MKTIYITNSIDVNSGELIETSVADTRENALTYFNYWHGNKQQTDILDITGKVMTGENRLTLHTLEEQCLIDKNFINHYEYNKKTDQIKMEV